MLKFNNPTKKEMTNLAVRREFSQFDLEFFCEKWKITNKDTDLSVTIFDLINDWMARVSVLRAYLLAGSSTSHQLHM